LNRSVFSALLNKVSPDDYADLKTIKYVDSNVYTSLKWVQENDPSVLEQFFTAPSAYNIERELKQNGSKIQVTNENKEEFIRLKCAFTAYGIVKAQLDKVRAGFYTIVPLHWIEYFTADELEAQMCGSSVIDVDDWQQNTELRGFNTILPSLTLMRFWEIMRNYN
jgi:hypothetical protein